ncbi:MAG: hypothetical protein LH645_00750, partial [Actinomycetia bacterium]|nr:hypothetical protein [Actinomycetes bacterium]
DGVIGRLLVEVADGLAAGSDQDQAEQWVERTRDLDGDLDAAWALVRQARESARLNPRRSARGLRDPQEWHELLTRMEQAVAETRSMARTLALSLADGRHWDPAFRERFVAVLHRSGQAIDAADQEPLRVARAELDEVVAQVARAGLEDRLWPEYGAVLTNLRNVLDAMDEVARANPLGQPPLPLRRRPAQQRGGARP